MPSILNNVAALQASRQLGITGEGLQKTIERLTTGRRINRASDDASGLAISNKLGADIRVAAQGRRNAADGISYLQVADGALEEVTNLLTRAAELAEQGASDFNASNITTINAEYLKIQTAIDSIGTNTKFNAQQIFTTSTISIHAGDYGTIAATVGTISSAGLTLTAAGFTNTANAQTEIAAIRNALSAISSTRGNIGAAQSQLGSVSNSLGIQVENFTASYSQIRDANISDEVVALTKFQVLNQAGTSALSQANQAGQSVLSLLR